MKLNEYVYFLNILYLTYLPSNKFTLIFQVGLMMPISSKMTFFSRVKDKKLYFCIKTMSGNHKNTQYTNLWARFRPNYLGDSLPFTCLHHLFTDNSLHVNVKIDHTSRPRIHTAIINIFWDQKLPCKSLESNYNMKRHEPSACNWSDNYYCSLYLAWRLELSMYMYPHA